MKISVKWLRDLVDLGDMPVDKLAHALTMGGLEVEEITPVAAEFEGIVVAHVKSVAPHPNADKLRVTEVDAGTGETLAIVCGAPNVAAGQKVPCALIGAKLPASRSRKRSCAASNRTACCARRASSGFRRITRGSSCSKTMPGRARHPRAPRSRRRLPHAQAHAQPGRLPVDVRHRPRRGRHHGEGPAAPEAKAVAAEIPGRARDHDHRAQGLRPILRARHQGINATARTPAWMVRRLERAGLRSISPLVDITNYVMLERGQPMHAFDQSKLKGAIGVRFMKPGEELKLLSEQESNSSPTSSPSRTRRDRWRSAA
jgi:phenylalanyl-tRNA synthetase beta chain